MDYDPNKPVYLQVVRDIQRKLITGKMPPGEKLPAVRETAVAYTINPNTAARVYRELESSGLCFTRRGIGTFITEDHETIKRLRHELAVDSVETFLAEMKSMGFLPEETLRLLKERGVK